LAALALLGACGEAPTPAAPSHHGASVIRVLYRDGHDSMVLTFPRDGARMANDECHVALLIDGKTGAARRLSANEAKARTRTMQLSGATPGECQASP